MPNEHPAQFDSKSRISRFLGVADGAKANVFEDIQTKRRFISRDTKPAYTRLTAIEETVNDEELLIEYPNKCQGHMMDKNQNTDLEVSDKLDERELEDAVKERRVSKRVTGKPARYLDEYAGCALSQGIEPETPERALKTKK